MAELANDRCVPSSTPSAGPFCAYENVACLCDESTCTGTDCAWFCEPKPKEDECPWGQPNLGTICEVEGLTCTYTTCWEHRCVAGYWTSVDTGACAMTRNDR